MSGTVVVFVACFNVLLDNKILVHDMATKKLHEQINQFPEIKDSKKILNLDSSFE